MKLVQAREWADIYLSSPHLSQEVYSLEAMLIDAYTAGWREGWDDGEMCGYNRGREHNETDYEVGRNAGIQEGIDRMYTLYDICPECRSVYGKHKMDCGRQ